MWHFLYSACFLSSYVITISCLCFMGNSWFCSYWDMQARLGKLSDRMVKFIRSISGWTATLLFMWMPIAQMVWECYNCFSKFTSLYLRGTLILVLSYFYVQWTTYLNPDNIKGLSAFTILLGMIGNGLMIPRALFIRDLMWYIIFSFHHSFMCFWSQISTFFCSQGDICISLIEFLQE